MTNGGHGTIGTMLAALLLLASSGSSAEPADTTAAATQARGRAVFVEHCARCHGDRADGDSRVAAVLRPPPANLRASTMSADDLERMIRLGGEAAFGRSPTMPAWGETLQDAQIRDVIGYIRSLGANPTMAKVR